ncbi:MBG domain-containing protein, partial [Arthrospira platensis SPKY1]|nr:MBG domain-containing protein [Arthrospira platensis SPKY1]
NNESVTSVTLTSTGTAATALAGGHNIVPSNATGINNFNPAYYNITYVNGTLFVEQRPITITVNTGQNKVYSTADPVFGYMLTSGNLVNGDVFSGALARATGENVASNYAI